MLLAGRFSLRFRLAVLLAFIAASVAIVLLGFDKIVSGHLAGLGIAGVAAAGAFYTLGATTPFAMIVIIELMGGKNAVAYAFLAAFTAAAVDCFLFSTVKDALERNAEKIREKLHSGRFKRFSRLFPIAGFFAFGLPVPDEIAIALTAFGKIRTLKLFVVVFFAKFFTLLAVWHALTP